MPQNRRCHQKRMNRSAYGSDRPFLDSFLTSDACVSIGKGLKNATRASRSPLKEDWPRFVASHCIDDIVDSVRSSNLLLDRSTHKEEEVRQNLFVLAAPAELRDSLLERMANFAKFRRHHVISDVDNDIRSWSSSLRSISFLRPTARLKSNLLAASTLRVRINYEEEEEEVSASHAGLSSWLLRSFLTSRPNINSWSSSTLNHGSWEADVTFKRPFASSETIARQSESFQSSSQTEFNCFALFHVNESRNWYFYSLIYLKQCARQIFPTYTNTWDTRQIVTIEGANWDTKWLVAAIPTANQQGLATRR